MAQPSTKTVLFLCTGNYYRSRFAEILFNSVAAKMGLPWTATSAALALERGVDNVGPISPLVLQELQARGIHNRPAIDRSPKQALLGDFESANKVVALKQAEHEPLLQERYFPWHSKVEYWYVDDLPGIFPLIEIEVMDLAARLILGGKPRPSGPRAIPSAPPASQKPMKEAKPSTIRIGRETKGRRGKGVTIIYDLPLDEPGLQELATRLKSRCGTGGTVKDGTIEIQGDQRDRLTTELESLGYRVKRSGG